MSIQQIFIEIDTEICSRVYSSSPCTASIGVTGDDKCYNTRNKSGADCQDTANYDATTKTLRFGLRDSGNTDSSIQAIPLLKRAEVTGGRVNPGEDYGLRLQLNCSFYNAKHSDAGIDPYYLDRGYIAFESGTFWGKFRARNTYLQGHAIRIYEGYVGQSIAEMRCRSFLIDKMVGPGPDGEVQISATDFMSLLDKEKSVAPVQSGGYLLSDYPSTTTAITLSPTGVGDLEYSASGRCAIGKSLFDFTRSGDVMTITPGLSVDAKSGELVQETLVYSPQSPALILADLIETYTPLGSSYVDSALWESRLSEQDSSLYTREIVKPIAVRTLINELIQQCGLVVYADTEAMQIYVDILRPAPVEAQPISDTIIEDGTFTQEDQPQKRFDNVTVYFDKRDPFATDEPESYYSATTYIVEEVVYPTPNERVIYSKWVPTSSLSAAVAIARRFSARYNTPPRKFTFSMFATHLRSIADILQISHPTLESASGSQESVMSIITRANTTPSLNKYEAEEYSIDSDISDGDILISIDADVNNLNLLDLYFTIRSTLDTYPGAPNVIFTVSPTVVIGSSSTASPALETGSWPNSFVPQLVVSASAYIAGAGGDGGDSADGDAGGDAINVSSDIEIVNNGTIGGGGGGGGGVGSGGGAGRIVGISAPGNLDLAFGAPSLDSGGAGNFFTPIFGGGPTEVYGGGGGDLGQDGIDGADSAPPNSGALAGNAINGVSMVTLTNNGSILGDQIG